MEWRGCSWRGSGREPRLTRVHAERKRHGKREGSGERIGRRGALPPRPTSLIFSSSAFLPATHTPSDDIDAKVRAEVEAPFRIVRLVLCGFFAGSASVGAAIALVQTLSAAAGSAAAPVPLAEAAQSLGIDLAAAGAFAFFFSRDWAARQKQLARLSREGALGAQRIRLASGKTLRLRDLRGFARPVLLTGSPAQVGAALAAVTPELKQALVERGVLVVPLPVEEGAGGGPASSSSSSSAPAAASTAAPAAAPIPPLTPADLRWRAAPANPAALAAWFADQAAVAGADPGRGLYVGLRMDGRVRASGVGCPNWGAFAAQLPPVEAGAWDGMDGKI